MVVHEVYAVADVRYDRCVRDLQQPLPDHAEVRFELRVIRPEQPLRWVPAVLLACLLPPPVPVPPVEMLDRAGDLGQDGLGGFGPP